MDKDIIMLLVTGKIGQNSEITGEPLKRNTPREGLLLCQRKRATKSARPATM